MAFSKELLDALLSMCLTVDVGDGAFIDMSPNQVYVISGDKLIVLHERFLFEVKWKGGKQ